MDTSFLKATRFWVMLIGSLSIYAQAKGWIGEAEMQLIATVSGLFIAVRTVDRLGEKLKNKKKTHESGFYSSSSGIIISSGIMISFIFPTLSVLYMLLLNALPSGEFILFVISALQSRQQFP